MDFLYQLLNALRYLPVVIPSWVWMGFGILLSLSLIYAAFRRSLPEKPKLPVQKPIPPSVTISTEDTTTAPAKPSKPKRCWRFCHKHFSPLFKDLLRHLRQQVSGRDYRYEIPWVLQIGETSSGKTTLLHDTGLDTPFGIPETSDLGCEAWLFEKGVVFDLAGKYVLNAQAGSDAAGWRDFLFNLKRYRPHRPLDAVILTIAVDELLARKTQPDIAKNKAEHLYQKLRSMQKKLGMRLPIYILLTRCDHLLGFDAFTQALPERLRNNLFGWSNPFSLETTYNETFVEHAFQALYHAINELQLELVTAPRDISDQDAFLSFPHQFRPLLQQLKVYLDSLFRASVYHEAFFLRGIYCCGDGSENTPRYEHQDALSDDIHFKPQMQERSRQRFILFLHHLFRDKVFAEQALARPVRNLLRRQNYRLRFAQFALVLGTILLFGLQWQDYQRLKRQKEQEILPTLEEIIADQQAQKNAETAQQRTELEYSSAKRLLDRMSHIETKQFRAVLLPASWWSSLNTRIEQALAVAYQDFIADWLYDRLVQKVRDILTMQAKNVTVPVRGYEYITQPSDYQALNDALSSLEHFQTHVKHYNNLEKKIDEGKKLAWVEEVAVYTYKMPKIDRQIHKESIAARTLHLVDQFKAFNTPLYRQDVQRHIAALLHGWLNAFFSHNLLLLELQRVNVALGRQNHKHPNVTDALTQLQAFEKAVEKIEAMFQNQQWHWVEAEHIQNLPEVAKVFSSMDTVSLLETKFTKAQQLKADQQFQNFRTQLNQAHAELTQRILGQTVTSTPPLTTLPSTSSTTPTGTSPDASTETKAADSLNARVQKKLAEINQDLDMFKNQDFMQEVPPKPLINSIPFNKILFWRVSKLQAAYELTQSYQKFIHETLSAMPSALHLQADLRDSSTIRMKQNLPNLIAQAQELHTQTFEKTIQEDTLNSYSQNFQKALPWLKKLLVFMQKELPGSQNLHYHVHQLISAQAQDLLGRTDILLNEAQLYEPVGFGLQAWQGESSLAQQTFDVGDQEELEYLLKLMSQRITYLAKHYAEGAQQYLYENPSNNISTQSLVPKWRHINETLVDYQAKKPDNTLNELEKFILFDLDKITPVNCFNTLHTSRLHAKQDYFTRKQTALTQKVFQRCVQLAEESSFTHYSVISGFFNERLAGHFPFLPITPDEGKFISLDPLQLQDFYGIYQLYQENLQQQIENVLSFGDSRYRATQFLTQIAFAQPVFQEMLGPKPKSNQPAYNFQVEFRVNRSHEKGANQIIGWEMRVNDLPIKQIKGQWQGTWKYGENISLKLRWARNSAFRPHWNGSPSAEIFSLDSETEAVFTYRSEWALLEMLARQRPKPEDVDVSKYRTEELVQLTIPVVQLVSALIPGQADKSQIQDLSQEDTASTPTPIGNQPVEEKSVPIVLYQEQYRPLFELFDTAVVFMHVKLFLVGNPKQSVTFTALPDSAPTLESDTVDTRYLPPNQYLKPAPYQSLPAKPNEKAEKENT